MYFIAKNSTKLNKLAVKYFMMASINDTKKIYLNDKDYSASQTYNQYPEIENFQSLLLISPSLPQPPSLQFQKQQKKIEIRKDSAEQRTVIKDFLDNTKENIGKYRDNSTIIQYPFLNSDTLIDYYKQTTESRREISLVYLKLQKEYIDAFQPKWIEHIRTSVDNYLVFQDKMIMLCTQMWNNYLKNIGNIKTKNEQNQEKMEGS
jgi:hypothetical protein